MVCIGLKFHANVDADVVVWYCSGGVKHRRVVHRCVLFHTVGLAAPVKVCRCNMPAYVRVPWTNQNNLFRTYAPPFGISQKARSGKTLVGTRMPPGVRKRAYVGLWVASVTYASVGVYRVMHCVTEFI